jgi:hypothetical protein
LISCLLPWISVVVMPSLFHLLNTSVEADVQQHEMTRIFVSLADEPGCPFHCFQ